MTLHPSRRSAVEPFHAMDVLAKANRLAAAGHAVVSLAVGQPSDPAPALVRAAAAAALRDGRIGYTDALGRRSLREAIAVHYADHYGVEVSPERVVVTTGSSAGFTLSFLSLFDSGARLALGVPGYPAYRAIVSALGLRAVELRLDDRGRFDLEELADHHAREPIDGLLFASPANPTGAVMPDEDRAALLSYCREAGIAVISDEIYHRLNHVGADHTALAAGNDVVVINSFSKYYCMTGWRIGWMIVPDSLVRTVERLQQSLYISAPDLSQIAAEQAFNASAELEAVKARYATNRDLLARRLPEIGLDLVCPMDGAFYAYCDVSRFTNDSMEFAGRMLQEAHVAATPGQDFDQVEGHRTLRISYAGATDDIVTATNRLAAWLAR